MDVELKIPSFKEFIKNRERFVGRADEAFGHIDKGSTNLSRYVQKHIYELEGVRCRTLEEVERVARDRGIPLEELDYRPEVIPNSGLKCDLLIKFVPKHVRDRRQAWG